MNVHRHELSDTYLELLRRLPLRPICSDVEYDEAAAVLQDLFLRDDLDHDEQGYVDTLSMLLADYDREHFEPELDHRPPVQRLKALMQETGMTINDLGAVLGSQPAASMVLAGKRQLSKAHIRRLAEHFRMEAGYFL